MKFHYLFDGEIVGESCGVPCGLTDSDIPFRVEVPVDGADREGTFACLYVRYSSIRRTGHLRPVARKGCARSERSGIGLSGHIETCEDR